MSAQKLDKNDTVLEKGSTPSIRRWMRNALFIAGLHTAAFVGANVAIEEGREITESNVAHAQEDPREAERLRLFLEGTEAFRRGDFLTARTDFLQSERLGRDLHTIAASPEMSWNIALCDIRLSGFELVYSDTAAAEARTLNARNEARLEAVLGFSTIAQIQPVRDNLTDARDRMRDLMTFYTHQLEEIDALAAPANARERRERAERRTQIETNIRMATEAAGFIDRFLGRIEPRYHELERASSGGRDSHGSDGAGDGHRGSGDRVITVEGREYIERTTDVWFTTPRAVFLATGIAGLAASGVGLAGYVLNNSDGQANLAQCRELQSRMMPCPLSLEREFQGNSDRATAFSTVGWIGAGLTLASTVLFLVLPSETRTTREPRTSSPRPRAYLDVPQFVITPVLSDTYGGISIGGRF